MLFLNWKSNHQLSNKFLNFCNAIFPFMFLLLRITLETKCHKIFIYLYLLGYPTMLFKKLAQSFKWLYVYVLNYVKTLFWWSEDKVPGPFSLPIFGSLWLYTWMGPYSHDRYYYVIILRICQTSPSRSMPLSLLISLKKNSHLNAFTKLDKNILKRTV